MRISECREEDVVLLDEHMPCPGSTSLHVPRYVRHRAGVSTFLIAWSGRLPVGSCEVLWEGCAAPEVRAVHEECAEIQGLGNWPGTLRAQGVGTALIHAAESRVRQRSRRCVGLGVEKNNPRTADLYKRLGYSPSLPYLDCGTYRDGSGVLHRVADACTFMVKYL
jgi:hypothetical protein